MACAGPWTGDTENLAPAAPSCRLFRWKTGSSTYGRAPAVVLPRRLPVGARHPSHPHTRATPQGPRNPPTGDNLPAPQPIGEIVAPTFRPNSRPRAARGAALIYLTVTVVALIALASLAVDVGRVYVARGELQLAADA